MLVILILFHICQVIFPDMFLDMYTDISDMYKLKGVWVFAYVCG